MGLISLPISRNLPVDGNMVISLVRVRVGVTVRVRLGVEAGVGIGQALPPKRAQEPNEGMPGRVHGW